MDFDKDFDIELADFKVKKRDFSFRYWIFEYGGSVEGCGIDEDVVYFGSCDYHIYAVDAESGKMVWKFRTGGSVPNFSPAFHGDVLFLSSYDNYLYCLDKRRGAEIWKFKSGD